MNTKKYLVYTSRFAITFFAGLFMLNVFFAKAQTNSEANSEQIKTHGLPAQLDIREAGESSVRITLKPLSFEQEFPDTPVLVDREYPDPVISLQEISNPIKEQVGNLTVEVQPDPLAVIVTNSEGEIVQELSFQKNGTLEFKLDDSPVLGMGEGGPNPPDDYDWRELPIEFDRRGRLHEMHPRWQSNAYGSRNPVAMMIGTAGWGVYIPTPWGQVDMRNENHGTFIPRDHTTLSSEPQSREEQHANQGQGIPPLDSMVPGLFDVFVFDAQDPADLMKDISSISGKAVMPPKWALGYMQSHRTLEDDEQMVNIVETFREKEIPLDAVIYLGTGFTPRGWNKEQPSFEYNPEVFQNMEPEEVIEDIHNMDAKFIVHMVPWDRDKLPTLHGSIPPESDETLDEGHIKNYWEQHEDLVEDGVDAWWPDEGDWFNLFERMKRHQLYYEGPLSTEPDTRPWSLHRNGHLGISRWGGWMWSGDPQSTWKTLEGQIAVGLNHSLSISPFWGSDIGGFFSTEELDGELYTRWFQFGAFVPSFRSHGRGWWTRLPWGWGLKEPGPLEGYPLDTTALGDERIEPIAKKYAELRYRLLPYNYTLAWEARDTGMPMMRAMWLHYPEDEYARDLADQYLWGRDLLVAPVYKKDAQFRQVYLPEGEWYDWWTGEKHVGGKPINRKVDLSTMPIYVRAGAIIPLDPVRQYTDQEVDGPTTLRIYPGSDGTFDLYEDDGKTLDYLEGEYSLTRLSWDNEAKVLTIEPQEGTAPDKQFRIELAGSSESQVVDYTGERTTVEMN
jgi:alpha-glucosidase/alpha-D-xyloside xylohydrolase